jgi:hypothetical protein
MICEGLAVWLAGATLVESSATIACLTTTFFEATEAMDVFDVMDAAVCGLPLLSSCGVVRI